MRIKFVKAIVIIGIIVVGTILIPIIMMHDTKMPMFVSMGMLAAIAAVVKYKPQQNIKDVSADKHELDKKK